MTTMPRLTREQRALNESVLLKATFIYCTGQFSSVRACATAFNLPEATLRRRLKGHVSRSTAHENMQNLSPAEEETLVRWIARLTRTGYPISPSLTLKMAEEVRRSRVTLSSHPHSYTTLISRRWLSRFYSRHPEIEGAYARQIDNARFKAINLEGVKRWFAAVTELILQHNYATEDIYNMDESGFSVGASQCSRKLVNVREKTSWKRINGRQEWITAIECIRASGEALPPLLIFKAKHTNSA